MNKWKSLKISYKNLFIITLVIYVLSIIPMLWIGMYNYPSADDFNMGVRAYKAFQETGNPLSAIGAGFYMGWYDWVNWMGYFTSTVLMSVPPSVFGETVYPIGIWIELALLTFATGYFLNALLVKVFHLDRYAVWSISLIVLMISEQCMPRGLARVEMFYWYCSAANYLLTYCLTLIFLGLLISFVKDKGRRKRIYDFVMASFLAFWIGGGNYMSALSCAIVLILTICWRFLVRRNATEQNSVFVDSVLHTLTSEERKREILLLFPTILMLLGFAASCLAPGNANRASALDGMGAVKSILISLLYTLIYTVSQWTDWTVIVLIAIMAIVMWVALKDSKVSFRYPILVLVIGYGLISANITPSIYAEGNISAGRLQGLFWMQYVLILALVEWYCIGWLRQHLQLRVQNLHTTGRKQFGATSCMAMLLLSLLLVFGVALNTAAEPNQYTSTTAMRDLLNGKAERYAEINAERRAILRDETQQDVILPSFDAKPELLFYSDVEEDDWNWQNKGVARYYDKNTVVRGPET